MKRPLVNGLLPFRCLLCGLPTGVRNVCRGCRGDLPWIRRPCRRCGAELPRDSGGAACGECHVEFGGADIVLTAMHYAYPVDRLVTWAKFRSRVECALTLGELLAVYLRSRRRGLTAAKPDMLIPVPLHRRRLIRRGYNQAEEIARPLAAWLGVPLLTRACCRVVNTIEQTTLDGEARRQNLADTFAATADVEDRRIAIVDDVMTTGSTVAELAATLKSSGARSVEAWAVARSTAA